ncbi:MAG: hypothetical protein ACI9Y1_000787 [Lentisphaeria bacterium]|jgi:hypothetical protein
MSIQTSPSSLILPNEAVREYHSIAAKGPMLDRVYSMRYRSYSEEGYIEKSSSKKFMDEFDSLPSCTSYLTYFGKKAIGSVRASVYTPANGGDVPAMEVFEKEIRDNVDMDKPFVETNKFVIDPSFQKSGGVRARFNIFKNIAEEAVKCDASSVIIAVRPEHVKFYRLLLFKPISGSKKYPHLAFDTVLLMCNEKSAIQKVVNRG